ncbi:MAG: Cobalamin-binding protein precursor [Methanomassiliicoccales archaeon PtaU1.Bin124]|nr:MAG: Cobalamin-binding protein precursor [Methanomassiliicoccales archaeon PtaU1.Bin124]
MESKGKALAAIAVVALLLIAGMWVLLGSGKKDTSVTLTDAMGREVTVATKPDSVVSCSPAITEMIYSFGAGDILLGCTSYCDYPSQVVSAKENGTVKVIGNFYTNLNTEMIIGLSPDIVFMEESVENSIQQISKLDDAGIKVVVLKTASGFEAINDNFDLMGKALHLESKASQLSQNMDLKLKSVATKVAGETVKPSVMIAVYWNSNSIWVAGNGTSIDEILASAGGNNAFHSSNSYDQVNAEDILAADPDIIVLCGMALGNADVALSQLQNDPVLKDLNAVKNGKVYVLLDQSENTLVRQGERMVEGAYLLAMIMYPELFTKTLPKTLYDDYKSYLPSTW